MSLPRDQLAGRMAHWTRRRPLRSVAKRKPRSRPRALNCDPHRVRDRSARAAPPAFSGDRPPMRMKAGETVPDPCGHGPARGLRAIQLHGAGGDRSRVGGCGLLAGSVGARCASWAALRTCVAGAPGGQLRGSQLATFHQACQQAVQRVALDARDGSQLGAGGTRTLLNSTQTALRLAPRGARLRGWAAAGVRAREVAASERLADDASAAR